MDLFGSSSVVRHGHTYKKFLFFSVLLLSVSLNVILLRATSTITESMALLHNHSSDFSSNPLFHEDGKNSAFDINTETFSCELVSQLEDLQLSLGLRTKSNQNTTKLLNRTEILEKQQTQDHTDRHSNDPEILLTDYGWMSPERKSSHTPRSKWSALWLAGIQSHRWYNPAGWAAINELSRPDSTNHDRTKYVFLDVETVGEGNWPRYGGDNYESCDGIRGSAIRAKDSHRVCCRHDDICGVIKSTLQSPIFSNNTNNKLIVPHTGKEDNSLHSTCPCLRPDAPDRDKIVLVAISMRPSQMLLGTDMGLPPPPQKVAKLTQENMEAIQDCSADLNNTVRPFYFSFKGTNWKHAPVRGKLIELRRNQTGEYPLYIGDAPDALPPGSKTYEDVLTKSKFSAAPRGDMLFSYRFTEILAAGAIPVVYSDGWVLPFSRDLIGWEEYMVVIKENKAGDTFDILSQISDEKRCQMRKKGWEFYNKYYRSRAAVLQGIVDTLESRRREREQNNYTKQEIVATDYSPFPECWKGGSDVDFAMKCLRQ